MKLGIIGGSGLYALPQLAAAHRISQETPWGWPSDALVEGRLEGLPVVFLPRHGPHHSIAPAEINYRANIAALRAQIKQAFNLVYRAGLNVAQAKARLRAETGNPFAAEFADFLDHAKRGICRPSFDVSDEPADA